MVTTRETHPVIVACPDARPPAYQAVVGLSRAGLLDAFVTAGYYDPRGGLATLARRIAPSLLDRVERLLLRRHDAEIPAGRVRSHPSYDLAIRLESRLPRDWQRTRRTIARARTNRFDGELARLVGRSRPGALLVFSDVGSDQALTACRTEGIPAVLSMVHGDVREECQVLREEADRSPEFLPIYLGDARLDRVELDWLHQRRLRELEVADRVVVPSEHIAGTLVRHGTPGDRVRVIPYAADCRRFRPTAGKVHGSSCKFLFAGGISQRKGIGYLLQAWRKIRRPGWRLQLLGPSPRELGPLRPYLDEVELLGRVAHSEMPARLAAADVFVFPSLFEGSAVVTYEALASGLPSVVTPQAGSVVRDGLEGFLVASRDVDALAERLERLGIDPPLRKEMGAAARARALCFDWPRYHAALIEVVRELIGPSEGADRGSTRCRATELAAAHPTCEPPGPSPRIGPAGSTDASWTNSFTLT
jgi:glycosyltransferase involved in cell wall biosynthesis